MPSAQPRWLRLLLLSVVLGLAGAPGVARAGAPTLAAPLGMETSGPLRQLFLDPPLTDARMAGDRALALRLQTANSWSVPTTVRRNGHTVLVQLDSQADTLAFSLRMPWNARPFAASSDEEGRHGWRSRGTTTVSWRITGFWGGFEDGGIEAWHRLVGAYNFRRQFYPPDHINLTLREEGGPSAFNLHSGRLSIGDVVIGNQLLLASGGRSRVRGAAADDPRWGVATRLDLKVPIGSLGRAGGSGGLDVGTALLGTFELTPWMVVHGMVHASAFSHMDSDIALQPQIFQYGIDFSLVTLAGNWAFLLEDRWLSTLMEDGWSVDDGGSDNVYLSSAAFALFRPQNQISFGIRYRALTLTFAEDFTIGANEHGKYDWYYDTNAPDAVLNLTWVTRF